MVNLGCSTRRTISAHVMFGVCLCLATVLFTPCAWSQAAGDQVHVVPFKPSANVPSLEGGELLSSTKPLQVDVDLVMLPVVITDADNHPVTGLKKHNFAVFDGDEQQQIRYFSTEDAPISVGVILDLSKSMSNKIDTAREAVAEFFNTANPEDDYFLVTFADRPELLADATQSIGSIQAKLASAKPAGHTALLDAIYLGLQKARSARYQRRALLIISDGGDNRSRYGANEIKRLVEEADVEIYAIGIFDSIFKTPEEWAGKRLLTDITEATGGRTITLHNVRELPKIAARVSLELRNQYVLGFRPSNPAHDGTWRKVKVRVTPPLSSEPLRVYSKKGYLAADK